MSAKVKKAYFCKNCGFEAPKWLGKCPSCGEWNTFTEEIIARESGPVTANVAGPLPASRPQRVPTSAKANTAGSISETPRSTAYWAAAWSPDR